MGHLHQDVLAVLRIGSWARQLGEAQGDICGCPPASWYCVLLVFTCLVSGLPRRAVGLRLEDWQIACSRCSPRTCPAAELPRICFWLRPDGGTICRSRAPGAALGPFPAAELPQICFCCALRAH